VKSILPHIELGEDTDGIVCISVDDYELYDYISDYLVEECGIEYTHMSSKNDAGPEVFRMHLSENYNLSDIENYLMKLDSVEIERIYSLNN